MSIFQACDIRGIAGKDLIVLGDRVIVPFGVVVNDTGVEYLGFLSGQRRRQKRRFGQLLCSHGHRQDTNSEDQEN